MEMERRTISLGQILAMACLVLAGSLAYQFLLGGNRRIKRLLWGHWYLRGPASRGRRGAAFNAFCRFSGGTGRAAIWGYCGERQRGEYAGQRLGLCNRQNEGRSRQESSHSGRAGRRVAAGKNADQRKYCYSALLHLI